ncbi:MAG: alkaline phosphatase family protein [Cyanothece sp. SIO1E1]|nr:alkaline phosphatase family protein [Cyanothece sp. SIO1E1]
MKVKPLSVGPILGAVTGHSAHLLGRGDFPSDDLIGIGFFNWVRTQILRRSPPSALQFGVIRMRVVAAPVFQSPHFFKLDPTFDLTGIAVLNGLKPTQRYEYQMGWIAIRKADSDRLQTLSLDWSEITTYRFQTGSIDPAQSRSFILGSCRYLLRLFGGRIFDQRGDVTFRSALQQVAGGVDTHALVMVGDQIYADDLNVVAADRNIDEFFQRYRDAFTQPAIRNLMARVPTYMTLDDHEIEDNWPSNASQKDWVTIFPVAIHAYTTYQLSHSPLFSLAQGEVGSEDAPTQLWYRFSDGCCDFFITDTRTERQLSEGEEENRKIISDEQLEALQKWLIDGSGRIKLIASAVPFFPDAKTKDTDKWSGFLHQRTALLDFIADQQISPVIFLSGDVHCSMTAELRCVEQPNFKIISVISSAFFWPYPHTQGSSFQLEGTLKSYSQRTYQVTNTGPVYATDNFTRVTINPQSLQAEVFSRTGELCGTKVHPFGE